MTDAIRRAYVVRDCDGDMQEDEDGNFELDNREMAEELALQRATDHPGYGPYAVTVQVPGPGGWHETRACAVFEDGIRTWSSDVYEQEMAS